MTSKELELLGLTKCQIRFTSPEGEYEGNVLVICPVVKKMLISKCCYLPKRILMGTLSFQFREILSYTILNRPDATSLKKDSSRSTYSYAPPRAKDSCLLDDCSELSDSEIYQDAFLEDLYEEEAYELRIPPQHASRIPLDNVVFDRIDDEFHQAIEHIFRQDIIGVSLEGPKIGRNGILSWCCVATSCCTFLFDIDALGQRAFSEGLKKILENSNIEKVLHDCRRASDCLFHSFKTRLVNVFDTQVADLLVTMQRSKDCKFSKHVSTLDSCLRTYLEVPEEYIYKPKVYRTYEDSVVFFRQRPLQPEIRDLILKNVMYLRSLKRELNLALLTPLHRGVEVYLQVLLTATDRELLLEASVKEELPQELIMEGIQIVRFKEFVDVPPVVASGPPYRKLCNPVKEYADYCAKIDRQSSSLSNNNGYGCNANMQLAEKPKPPKESTSHLVDSNTSRGIIMKHTIAENMVRKNCSESGQNSDFSSINTDSDGSKTIAKIHQMKKNLQSLNLSAESLSPHKSQCTSDSDSEPIPPRKRYQEILMQFKNSRKPVLPKETDSAFHSSDSDSSDSITDSDESKTIAKVHHVKKDLPSLNSSVEYLVSNKSRDTSDSDSEPAPRRKRHQEILMKLKTSQEPVLAEEKNSAHSSSDISNSNDDDPWAAMRASFLTCDYSAEHTKRKIRFIPG